MPAEHFTNRISVVLVCLLVATSVLVPLTAGAVSPQADIRPGDSGRSLADTAPSDRRGVEPATLARGGTQVDRSGSAAERARRMAQASGGKVDVVFVLDDTGSMGGEIRGAKQNIRGFAEDLENESIDARYGLITFKDDIEVDQELTGDIDTFQESLDAVRASGGGDAREDNFDALERATEMDYRSGAKRVIVDITDERAHTKFTQSRGVTDLTMSEVVDFMEPYAAYVAVSDENFFGSTRCGDPLGKRCGDKRVLAQENLDSGSWVDLNQVDEDDESDFGDILETVKGVITDVVEPDSPVAAPDIEYVDAEFNRTSVPEGGTVRVNVTAVNRGDAGGGYIAAFRSDFRLIDTRRGRLGPGEGVELSANVTFEDTGDHRIFAARSYLGTVTVQSLSPHETSERYLDVEHAYVTRGQVHEGDRYRMVAVVHNTDDRPHEFGFTYETIGAENRETTPTRVLEAGERTVVCTEREVEVSPDHDSLMIASVNGHRAGNVTVHPSDEPAGRGLTHSYLTRARPAAGQEYAVVAVFDNPPGSPPLSTGASVSNNRSDSSRLRIVAVEPGTTERVRFPATAPSSGAIDWRVNARDIGNVSVRSGGGDTVSEEELEACAP